MLALGEVETVAGVAISGFLYFVPTVIAVSRRAPNAVSVFGVNLLLGWIGVGGLVALFMSVGSDERSKARSSVHAHRDEVSVRLLDRAAQLRHLGQRPSRSAGRAVPAHGARERRSARPVPYARAGDIRRPKEARNRLGLPTPYRGGRIARCPAGDPFDVHCHDRTGGRGDRVLRVLRTKGIEHRDSFRTRTNHPPGAVGANPPQPSPVVAVLVDEDRHGWVGLDVAQSL
jgi:Superinfection immunity protein